MDREYRQPRRHLLPHPKPIDRLPARGLATLPYMATPDRALSFNSRASATRVFCREDSSSRWPQLPCAKCLAGWLACMRAPRGSRPTVPWNHVPAAWSRAGTLTSARRGLAMAKFRAETRLQADRASRGRADAVCECHFLAAAWDASLQCWLDSAD